MNMAGDKAFSTGFSDTKKMARLLPETSEGMPAGQGS